MGWKALKEHYRIGHSVQVVPDKGICIGSPYIHDIIVVSMIGEITKRYDPGRGWSRNEDLDRYQAEMEADPALLKRLIDQPDAFERSLTVYTYEGGDIIECQCVELDWPNVTHDGRMMYENTFSPDRAKVVEWATSNARAGIENWTEIVDQRTKDLGEAERMLAERRASLAKLRAALATEAREGRDGEAGSVRSTMARAEGNAKDTPA